MRLAPRLLLTASLVLAVGGAMLPPSASPASAVAAYATIEGSGSTDARFVVDQWVADVGPAGIRVVYTGGGSGTGQQDFERGVTDFAVVDRPEEVSGREHAAVPLAATGLALTYRLEVDGRRVDGLRLSSAAVVGIFTGAVTRWDDPVVAADNPGLDLPHTAVTPVVRSDASATTGLLASWLDHEQPTAWSAWTGGQDVADVFPAGPTMQQVPSSTDVTRAVAATDGAIGYVPGYFTAEAQLSEAKVLNHAGYYVAPWQYDVAIALRGATVGEDGAADLTGVWDHTDRRAYPLSSYASAVVPTAADDPRMTSAKRQSLVDFLHYSVCTGQQKAGHYGYAPLPLPLVQAAAASLAAIGAADPRVDVPDGVEGCQNPTFDAEDLDHDVLAEIAPYPPSCDAQGESVCPHEVVAPVPSSAGAAVRLAAPTRAGVHVVRRDRAYLLTVRTRSSDRPRFYPAVAPGRPLRPGFALLAAGRDGEVRVWRRWVRVEPTDLRTWRVGVRVGERATVLRVRLQR